MWGARDPETQVIYLCGAHYRDQAEPSGHTRAIRALGDWIPGVIDPAARGRSQKDGEQLIRIYRDLGLDILPANHSVEAGLQLVWEMMVAGKLKVFESLQNWWKEFRKYRVMLAASG